MPRGKNCRETIFAAQLPRNCPHRGGQFKSLSCGGEAVCEAQAGWLEVVGRCLEGIEDVANPSDVEHAVDDVLHSVEDVVDVHLVHDNLLNFDVGLSLGDLLDDFLVLDAADELQDLVHDDILDFPGQPDDARLFLYDDVYAVDASLVLLTLDGYVLLDADHAGDVSVVGLDVDLLFCQVVDALDYAHLQSHCRCQSANC